MSIFTDGVQQGQLGFAELGDGIVNDLHFERGADHYAVDRSDGRACDFDFNRY
jgi:hypothetical protein